MVVASSNKTHMICVVCGKGFSSIYDEDLKLFPVYHSAQNSSLPCEGHFFKALVSIYECLHGQESTIQFSELLTQVDWGEVQLRKQMLSWCLNQGYLAVDSFNRFLVPPVIEDITKDLFCADNLSDPDFLRKAVDYLTSAFKVMKDELDPHSIKEEQEETASDTIDEELDNRLEERRKISRMFTADISGVEKRDQKRKGKGMYSR